MAKCQVCNTEYPDNLEQCPHCSDNTKQSFSCPVCSTEVELGERFCSGCGSELHFSIPITCSVCGAGIKKGGKFCSSCGAPAPTDYVVTAKGNTQIAEPSQAGELVVEEIEGEKKEKDDLLAIEEPLSEQVAVLLEEEPHEEETPTVTEEIEPQKKKSSKGLTILIIVVLAIIIALLIFWFKILPGSFGGKEPNKLPAQTESGDAPLMVPNEPSVSDSATTENTGEQNHYDYNAQYTIMAQWDMVQPFDENGLACVINQTDQGLQKGLINREGELVVPIEYSGIGEFKENMAAASVDDKFGFLDAEGRLVIRPEYQSVTDFSEGFSAVSKEGKHGFVDLDGNEKFMEYEYTSPFHNGVAGVMLNGVYFFIDTNGGKVSPDYEDGGSFSFEDELAPVKIGGKWGYVNPAFEVVIEPIYEAAESFSQGLGIVSDGSDKFFIDKTGDIKSPKVKDIWPLSEGLATVFDGALYGYVDGTSTDYVIEPQYIDALAYSEGLCAVSKNEGVWYYVDRNNEVVIPTSYDVAYSFQDGLARVQLDGKFYMIDAKGNFAVPQSWEEIGAYAQGMITIKEADKWGFVELFPA